MNKKIFLSMVITAAVSVILSVINIIFANANIFIFITIFLSYLLLSYFLSKIIAESVANDINHIDVHNPEKTENLHEIYPHIENLTELNADFQKELTELNRKYKSRQQMQQEFTANTSHELKTPLTSISGYAELIANNMVSPEDIPRFAGKIHDESQRLITLVGDILKLSRLDEGSLAENAEEIDLYELCDDILAHLEKPIADRNIKTQIIGEHLKINGIYKTVEEIIYNICDNAVKYNKPGGSVTITLNQYIDGVELVVTDTGIGISQNDINHIFERFYRADKSHSKAIGGTGLGLSIVEHGSMTMNAHIAVESKIGEGTTMKILF